MKVVCIVPSAGKGRRLKAEKEKPLVLLNGKAMLLRTLEILAACPFIDDIIVVVSAGNLGACRKLVKKYKVRKIACLVAGGKERFDSVRNGLRKINEADFVLIHDGARPFVGQDLIKKVFTAAKAAGAALSAVPSKQTLKLIDGNFFIKDTPKRKFLWEAQTPQAFKKDLILEAYKKAKDRNATDDSSLVEKLGYRVKIVRGSYKNIKITTPEDLALARVLIKLRRTTDEGRRTRDEGMKDD